MKSQSIRDSERGTTVVRISRGLLALIRDTAATDRRTIRETMESILRKKFKAAKI